MMIVGQVRFIVFGLLIFAFLLPESKAQPTPKRLDPTKLSILIRDDTLKINGQTVLLPLEPRQLISILGNPSRRDSTRPFPEWTWDNLGVFSIQTPEGVILGLEICFRPNTSYSFYPKQMFQGTLMLGKLTITGKTTLEEITKAKKTGKPFQKTKSSLSLWKASDRNFRLSVGIEDDRKTIKFFGLEPGTKNRQICGGSDG